MDVGSREWSKPADGVDELEWSQERWKQPSQSPCPAGVATISIFQHLHRAQTMLPCFYRYEG